MLEKEQLSPSSLIILMSGFLFGSTVLLTPGGTAGHDAWIAILLGLGEGLVFAFIFTKLSMRFRGKNLVEINDLVYGPFVGKIVSICFLWFLFHLGSLVLSNFGHFFGLVMPETPRLVLVLLTVLVSISAVKKGVEVIARCAELFVPINAGLIILDTFLLLNRMDFKKLLPVFDVPLNKLLFAAHGTASFPFGETVAFLLVFQYLNKNEKKAFSLTAKAFLLTGSVITIAVARNIMVLGNAAQAFVYPSFQTVSNINIGEILNRVEIIVAINFLTMGFIKISVLLYGTALGTAQVLGLRSYRQLVIPMGILMVVLEMTLNVNTATMLDFAEKIYPIYAMPFEVGIPLLTLVTALIRKLPREEVKK